MDKLLLFTLLIFLIHFIDNIDGIHCYNCLYGCSDPFNKQKSKALSLKSSTGWCMKFKASHNSESVVIRLSAPSDFCTKETCHVTHHDNIKGIGCCCNSNLCNNSNTVTILLKFNDSTKNYIENFCELNTIDRKEFSRCLRCYINNSTLPMENIKMNHNCSSLYELQCIELNFNNTQSFLNFSSQSINLFNELFEKNMFNKSSFHNALFIYIEYDSLHILTPNIIQRFENILNRKYEDLRFILRNRGNHTTLYFDSSIQNTTFRIIQVYAHCSDTLGWSIYNYDVHNSNTKLPEYIKCQLHNKSSITTISLTTVTQHRSSTNLLITTITNTYNSSTSIVPTERIQSNIIFMTSLIAGGFLLPCLLLACCLYVLCRRNNEVKEHRLSIPSSMTESISSSETVASNQSTKSSF